MLLLRECLHIQGPPVGLQLRRRLRSGHDALTGPLLQHELGNLVLSCSGSALIFSPRLSWNLGLVLSFGLAVHIRQSHARSRIKRDEQDVWIKSRAE